MDRCRERFQITEASMEKNWSDQSDFFITFNLKGSKTTFILLIEKENGKWNPTNVYHAEYKEKECSFCRTGHRICWGLKYHTNAIYNVLVDHSNIRLRRLFEEERREEK